MKISTIYALTGFIAIVIGFTVLYVISDLVNYLTLGLIFVGCLWLVEGDYQTHMEKYKHEEK